MNIQFTEHARYTMNKRCITEDEIISAIKYPEKTQKIGDKYYSIKNIGRGIIEVVFTRENYIKVITLYWI